jgi:hypothetical protein
MLDARNEWIYGFLKFSLFNDDVQFESLFIYIFKYAVLFGRHY